MTLSLFIQREPDAADLPLPAYATDGAAGMDLYAACAATVTLAPGAREAVSTGIRIAVPHGFEAQVRPRSGLALRHGLGVVNAPGTIDSDYRGIIKVILINLGGEPIEIKRGERIAQMVISPVVRARWEECDELPASTRGEGGFGHTGR